LLNPDGTAGEREASPSSELAASGPPTVGNTPLLCGCRQVEELEDRLEHPYERFSTLGAFLAAGRVDAEGRESLGLGVEGLDTLGRDSQDSGIASRADRDRVW
jgi:hypothetical protein